MNTNHTPTGNDHRDAYVLSMLADNGGAILAWQMNANDGRSFADACERGVISFDPSGDLYVHPAAVKVEDGAYEMPEAA